MTWKSQTKRQESYCEDLREEAQGTMSSSSGLHSDNPTQEFYVCFSGCGEYAGSGLMKKGFNHVSIMEKLPLGFIVHDPNKSALDTYILPKVETEDFITKFLEQRPDYTIVEVVKEVAERTERSLRLGVQSCVSIVAYIMGIELPFYCVTPHSLYKHLMRGGHGILKTRRLSNVEREKRSTSC